MIDWNKAQHDNTIIEIIELVSGEQELTKIHEMFNESGIYEVQNFQQAFASHNFVKKFWNTIQQCKKTLIKIDLMTI